MDPSKIPKHILRILQARELSMSQKMVAFTMLMPTMPPDPKNDEIWKVNTKLGEDILKLINDGKIRLGKFDKNFMLEVVEL